MIRVPHSGIPAFAVLTVVLCYSSAAFASGVVASATESSLVAAMAGGGTVTFAVNGTIYLTNTIVISNNTVLDATGQNVAINGSNAVQIFIINSNTTVAMTDLTLENGFGQGTYQNYEFVGGCGGAISNAGALQLTDCAFMSNGVVGASEPASEATDGNGGAIYNTGTVTASGCFFVGNSATGGFGGNGGPFLTWGGNGYGGAFFNANLATFINCVFSNNIATGGAVGTPTIGNPYPGEPGGAASGGAVCNVGSLVVSNSTFAQNVAAGGLGGGGGQDQSEGGEGYQIGGGPGAAGGNAAGGGVCSLGGSSILINETFWSNSAVAGAGGRGGDGEAAVGHYGVGGNGGNGGSGGNGSGGAFCGQAGSLLALNITAASNSVASGAGGAGGAGGTEAPFYDPTPGAPGAPGSPGVVEGDSVGNLGGVVTLKNSILVPNAPADTNIFGSIVDAGNNLDSDMQDSLTNSTSLNGINPELALLGDYGGPTPTMALLPDSPAIDAADPTDFPATDQRGVPRPFGPAPDIGAFEYSTPVTIFGQITGLLSNDQVTVTADHVSTLTTNQGAYSLLVADTSFAISPRSANYVFNPPSRTFGLTSNQTGLNFQAYRMNAITLGVPTPISFNFAIAGTNGQQFRVETSTNFTGWTPMATNTIGAAGYATISFPMSSAGSRFFRLVSP